MKKILFSIGMVALTISANAQLQIGAKGGFNYHFPSVSKGDAYPAEADDPKSLDGPGFHVGGFLKTPFNDKLGLRTELLFSTRYSNESLLSQTAEGNITTKIEADTKYSVSNIELPVMLDIKASEKLTIQAGPALGFLVGRKVKVTGEQTTTDGNNSSSVSLDTEDTSTEGLNTLEVAGVAGLTYHMENGLEFGIRYWRGFTSLEEETDFTKTNSNLVQISVGYLIKKD